MSLRYCFEEGHVKATLARSKPHDLAVIDTEGCEESVKSAVKRGVFVYGYLNAGALEKGMPLGAKRPVIIISLIDAYLILLPHQQEVINYAILYVGNSRYQ